MRPEKLLLDRTTGLAHVLQLGHNIDRKSRVCSEEDLQVGRQIQGSSQLEARTQNALRVVLRGDVAWRGVTELACIRGKVPRFREAPRCAAAQVEAIHRIREHLRQRLRR